ncbi:hypothetical protein Q0590_35300 [Rhodocytophaga aerolata]|uniref:Transposase n=1 Tax=Rhodocytophaga aerolata TaxID=455078 RepID=A0ABT8RHN3_9BACT|nr:hypothetical protein [Rhodocytophaga aerolata]MDO1451593.1 hypothetical protein [Rhodocytophaga aerolata]
MEEVLDAYERPYDKDYPLVGLDETRKQLVSETISSFTDERGVRHIDYEYKREGIADISGAKLKLVVHYGGRTLSW